MKTFKELAAPYLFSSVDKIELSLLGNSFTNYVYRAQSESKSLILKHSDNSSKANGVALYPRHLEMEFLFLTECLGQPMKEIILPTPYAFDLEHNTIIMSDLGSDCRPMIAIKNNQLPDTINFEYIGSFLSWVHQHTWSFDFMKLLNESKMSPAVYEFKLDAYTKYNRNYEYQYMLRSPKRQGLSILDFSPQNCMIVGEKIGIFDFDLLAFSDQLFDLANFLTRIISMFIKKQFPKHRIYIINSIVIGYFRENKLNFSHNLIWSDFCRYMAPLMYQRLDRYHCKKTLKKFLPIIDAIYDESFRSYDEIYHEIKRHI